MLGTVVSHYRIVGALGAGGMGEVYAAVDEALGRRVALKAIRAERRLSPGARARFLREARILSQLDHHHICRVYDYIAGDDADFIVLELVEGRSLRHAMAAGLDRADCLRIAQEVTAALVLAHSHGVVHRDLKPDNVMLTATGAVKVLDFGLAASDPRGPGRADFFGTEGGDRPAPVLLPPEAATFETPPSPTSPHDTNVPPVLNRMVTMAGQVLGTLCYMSPEQARGEPATPASDMYSLGLLLQELLTGAPAYSSALSPQELLAVVSRGETVTARTRDAHLTELVDRLKRPAAAERPTSKEASDRLRWIQDKPRRRRRAVALVAAVLLALLAGLKYTVDLRRERGAALAAREDADRRRDQAEELIGFMLGDLRARLEPVGRLDVLDEVGARATRYFAAVPESALTTEEIYRRAQALRQIGEVRTAQGNLDAAHEAFSQSLRLAIDLAERDPANPRWQIGLAASHFWIGSVAYYRSDFAAARAPFERYLEISRRLVARDPDNTEYRLELGYAYSNIGSVEESVGNLEAALQAFREVLAIKQRLTREDPTNPNRSLEVGIAHNKIGVVLEKRGDLAGAIEQYRIDRSLRAELVERDPADSQRRSHLSVAHMYLGNALRALGEVRSARVELEAAVRLSQSLVRRDPDNTDWQRGAAVAGRQLALVLLAQGDVRRALALLDQATAVLAGLVARDETNTDWLRQLAVARRAWARALLAAARPIEASREAARAVAVLERVLEKAPDDRRARVELAESHLTNGHIEARAGNAAAAVRAWSRAADVLHPVVSASFDADVAAPYAKALISLKRIAQAQAIVDDLFRRGYRDVDLLLACREGGLRTSL